MHVRLNYGRCGLEASLVHLVKLRASQISAWNRLSIARRLTPGTYQPIAGA